MIKQLLARIEKHSLVLFIVIFLIGAYSRFITVIDLTFPYTYDIGRDLLAISNIVHHFTIPLIGPTTGLPGLFYGPWWYYSLVPAFILGGGNPQVVDGFMVVTGLLVIIIGYYIGKKVQGHIFGLLYAALLAFSSSLIAAATQIWNPNVAPFYLILIYLVLVLLPGQKKGQRHVWLVFSLGFLAGLNIDSEVVYGLILTLGLTIFLVIFQFRKSIKDYIFYGLGLLLIFAPRIFFELRHNFIMTRTIFQTNVEGNNTGLFSMVPQEFVKALISLNQLWQLTIGIHNLWIGIVIVLVLVIAIVVNYTSYSVKVRYLLHFSLVSLATYIVALSLFHGDIWGHYIVGVPIIMLFLIAVAAIPGKNKMLTYGMYVVVLGILLFQVDFGSIYRYYTQPHPVGNASFYRNQVQVIDYVYKQANGRPFNEIVYTPPVHDYTYQYLFEWYGQKNYHYLPAGSKQQLFFVIFEPDPGYEGRLRDWLLQRKDDGKVVNEKVFPSGITVQTRLH